MSSLSTLRTRTRRLIDEEDTDNTHFEDTEIDAYLNQATLYLGAVMEWPLKTSTTPAVEDQALYGLPSDFISVIDVFLDNRKLTLVDRHDLSVIDSTWQDAPAATPKYAYKADNAAMGLWPEPDADSADDLLQIQYVATPATMSVDGDVPDVHEAFQICLPFYAAFLCEYKIGNDKRAELNLKLFDNHRKMLMSKLQKFSDDLLRFRWG